MIAQTPPMGWNSWNTFGHNINEKVVMETADYMVSEGYLEKGYEYLIVDDTWQMKERDEEGRLVADPVKFPSGMKALADYVHNKGLKFGIYSCAGILTCGGYPSSYDHEYEDARQFAEWGVDYLKYDFCNFPENADCKNRYLIMSMALKATGREIFYAACNWGKEDSWNWMRSIGAHSYRSTGDIFDNYQSFMHIFQSQLPHLSQSGPYCFNDMDMLTVGMYNHGHASLGRSCTDEEYRMQFSLWCLTGTSLILGADLTKMNPVMKELVLNQDLIDINQDVENRPPYQVSSRTVHVPIDAADCDTAIDPLKHIKGQLLTYLKFLSGGEFVLAYYNLHNTDQEALCIFADAGIPYHSGYGFAMKDVFTGEDMGILRDYQRVALKGHSCRLFRAKLVRCDD